ncbi:hypothetical protein QOZ80_7BG0606880 [Eleusine coracana subsp. coracana]|nr:hypothetical protein QOZ80_7BG0606880 [Eleusine coracana subsp. coracana]
MEEVAACDASSVKGSIPNAKGASLAEGTMARRGSRKGKAVMRPERTKEEEEELKRKMDEYLRLSAMSSDEEEEEELPPSTEGIDLVAIIGMKGEKAKSEARLALEAYLADETTRERSKAVESAVDRMKAEEPNQDERKQLDYKDWMARGFIDGWANSWSGQYGSYEDTTKIPCMRFTDDPAPDCGAWPLGTLQVFSFKVVGIRRGLQWPLDVFGMIAVRDNVDFNRNIIFNRTRDSCQTLTKKDQYLELAGPSRAVVWCDNIIIEVNLSVKGTTKSEDKDFSFLAVPMVSGNGGYSRLFHCFETSKLSTLGITLGYISHSVEATIFIKLIDGSFNRGKFAAFTTGLSQNKAERMDRKQIVLLDSGCEKVPIDGNGDIQLSRRVVSVEIPGELKVKVSVWKAFESEKNVVELVFTPKKAYKSYDVLDAGFCKMQITVAWSLLSRNR